jgi:CO/xanthine dehydrogenase Mo-binding subunit
LTAAVVRQTVPERIRLDDWDAVRDELRRFGESGDVTADDDRLRIDFGSAHVELHRDGRVSTGMPLHDFERDGAAELIVDHDAGALTVDADDVTYTFRRPGRP